MDVEFNTDLIERKCDCGFAGLPELDGPPNPKHGYRQRCPKCGKFLAWGGRKKQIKEGTVRIFSSQWTPIRLGVSVCQICLRDRMRLGDGLLHSHHIKPIKDGGKDEPSNILVVCTSCHRLIHHQQTYVNDHLKSLYDAADSLEKIKKEYPEIFSKLQSEAVA